MNWISIGFESIILIIWHGKKPKNLRNKGKRFLWEMSMKVVAALMKKESKISILGIKVQIVRAKMTNLIMEAKKIKVNLKTSNYCKVALLMLTKYKKVISRLAWKRRILLVNYHSHQKFLGLLMKIRHFKKSVEMEKWINL